MPARRRINPKVFGAFLSLSFMNLSAHPIKNRKAFLTDGIAESHANVSGAGDVCARDYRQTMKSWQTFLSRVLGLRGQAATTALCLAFLPYITMASTGDDSRRSIIRGEQGIIILAGGYEDTDVPDPNLFMENAESITEPEQPQPSVSAPPVQEAKLPKTLPIAKPPRPEMPEDPVSLAESDSEAKGNGTLTLQDAGAAQIDPAAAIMPEASSTETMLTLEDVEASEAQDAATALIGDSGAASTLTFSDMLSEDDGSAMAPQEATSAEPASDAEPSADGSADVAAADSCFTMEELSLDGSTILSGDAIDLMFADQIGSCITPEFIGTTLERLNGYYLDAGFVTTRAYITPQDLKTGKLVITVVEGRIEDIRLNENDARERRRISMAFSIAPGDLLNINDIDQGLSQLNMPASVQATLNLVPGTKAGETIVQIDEQQVKRTVRYKMGLDNSGSPGTGSNKSTLGVDADNLMSMNETVSISHIGSADTNALAASLTLPVGKHTLTYSGSYSDYLSNVDAVTEIYGRTDTHELKVTRALFKTKAGKVDGEVSLTKKSTRRTINDLVLTPTRLTVARAGMKYSGLVAPGVSLSANMYLAMGTGLLSPTRDVNLVKSSPRAQFRKLQTDGSITMQPSPGMTLQSVFAGQVARTPLYGSEQISAGGQKSVRGFARNSISGDSGFYVQTDLAMPMPEGLIPGLSAETSRKVQFFGGVDVGATRDIANGSSNMIAGTGGGVKMNFGGLSGEVSVGMPLYRKHGARNNRVDQYVKFLYSIAEL